MGSVSISTGRISSIKVGGVTSSKSTRGRKKVNNIEASARTAVLHIITLLDELESSRGSSLALQGKGAFVHWVCRNMPAECTAKPRQRNLIARRVAGMLLEGGERLRRVRHWTGERRDFYEVTPMGRMFLHDPDQYELVSKDKAQLARAMHPSTGTIYTYSNKSGVAA